MNVPGETYILDGDVTDISGSHGTIICMSITADNVTLDCQMFTINYAGGATLYSSALNSQINNCNIVSTSNDAIRISGDGAHLTRVFGYSTASASYCGINLAGSNSVIDGASSGYAVDGSGICFKNSTGSSNNLISGTSAVSSNGYGIFMLEGTGNIVATTFILSSTNYALFVDSGATGNIFVENVFQGDKWISDGAGSVYNNSNIGNSYIHTNGALASDIYDITCLYSAPCYSDYGADRPFSSSLSGGEWNGAGEDWFPYSYNLTDRYLDYCGNTTNTTSLTWEVRDLLTDTPINYSISVDTSGPTFTGIGNTTSNFSLCIFPPSGAVSEQLTDTVTSPGYSPITWNHLTQYYTNSTTNYKIYLLPSSGNNTKMVQIFVVDNTYTPMLNVSVKIEQVNPLTSAIITIGSFFVDSFGSTTQMLQPATQLYGFTVLNSAGGTLQSFSNKAIPCASTDLVCKLVLVVNPNSLPIDISTLSGSCSYDGSTRDITCAGTDTSNMIAFLNVSAFAFNNSLACSDQISGASGTVTCTLPDVNGTYNGYFFGIDTAGNNHLIATGTYTVGAGAPTSYGREGWLAAVLLVVIAATLMTGNLATSMVLGCLGLFVALAFGAIPLSDAPVVILLTVAALVLTFRMKV
jgi:hypothetical protein